MVAATATVAANRTMTAVTAPTSALRCNSPSPLEGRIARLCPAPSVKVTPMERPPSHLRRARDCVGNVEQQPEGCVAALVASTTKGAHKGRPLYRFPPSDRPALIPLRLTRSQFLATRSRLSAVTLSLPEPQLMRSRLPSRAVMVSLPAPPEITSRPEPPLILSLPPWPRSVSSPPPPAKVSLPEPPRDGVATAAAGEPVAARAAADAIVAALAAHAVVTPLPLRVSSP